MWSMHFQGIQKRKMANYLRRYDRADCVLSHFAPRCDCADAQCANCDPGPDCGFDPDLSPNRPKLPWHKQMSRPIKAKLSELKSGLASLVGRK